MGCFGGSNDKGKRGDRGEEKEFDGDWEEFANPLDEESQSSRRTGARGATSFEEEDQMRGDRSDARRRVPARTSSTLGGSISVFDPEGSPNVFDQEGSPNGRRGEWRKSSRDAQKGGRLGGSKVNAADRVGKTIAGTLENRLNEGVLTSSHYEERGAQISLDIVDWTDCTNMQVLKREAEERNIATKGRVFNFSMEAIQDALNKFDEMERRVNYKTADMTNFTHDRDKTWRNKYSKTAGDTAVREPNEFRGAA